MVEPFKAEISDDRDSSEKVEKTDDDSSSTDSFCSLNGGLEKTASTLLDKYRLLYTSFVRCMKYLSQIRDDALSGRAPSYIDYGTAGTMANPGSQSGINRNLQSFLAGPDAGDLSSAEGSSIEEPLQVAGNNDSKKKVCVMVISERVISHGYAEYLSLYPILPNPCSEKEGRIRLRSRKSSRSDSL